MIKKLIIRILINENYKFKIKTSKKLISLLKLS